MIEVIGIILLIIGLEIIGTDLYENGNRFSKASLLGAVLFLIGAVILIG
jgi:hypothetical protein